MKLFKESPAALERLKIALGPRGADELEAFLRTERMFRFVQQAVQGNSTTARQLVELGLAGGAGGVASGMDPHNWQVAVIVAFLTKAGAKRGLSAYDNAVAVRIAEALTSRDPNVIYRGLQKLAQPQWLQRLRAADKAFGATPPSGAATGSRAAIAAQRLKDSQANTRAGAGRIQRNVGLNTLEPKTERDTRPLPNVDAALGGLQ